MHGQNVIHRDLKLENILIDRKTKQTKLIDFGFGQYLPNLAEVKIQPNCGTMVYMSPELIQKKDYFGDKADVWALGVILFVLATGKYPFYAENGERDLHRKIITGKYRWP